MAHSKDITKLIPKDRLNKTAHFLHKGVNVSKFLSEMKLHWALKKQAMENRNHCAKWCYVRGV